jgi:hypothetical protein
VDGTSARSSSRAKAQPTVVVETAGRRGGGAGDVVLLLLAVLVGALALSGGLWGLWERLLQFLRYGPPARQQSPGTAGGPGGGGQLPIPVPVPGQQPAAPARGLPDNVIPFPQEMPPVEAVPGG